GVRWRRWRGSRPRSRPAPPQPPSPRSGRCRACRETRGKGGSEMTGPRTLVAKWPAGAPYLLSVLRIVAAFMFIQSGTMKLVAFPAGVPPTGGTVPLMSEAWIGGVLETAGGGLLLLGLFTRPVAFLLAGEMAV